MYREVKEFYKFLENKHKKFLFFQLALSLIQGFLEIFSIALIIPIFTILFNEEIILDNKFIFQIYVYFKFHSLENFKIFLLIAFSLFFLFSVLFNFLTNIFSRYFSNIIASDIGSRLFKYYIHSNLNFHRQNNKTDLIKKIIEEVRRLPSALITPLFVIISKMVVFIIIFSLLISVNTYSTLIIFFLLVIFYLVVFLSVKTLLSNNDKKLSNAALEKIVTLEEGLMALKEIKVFDLTNKYYKKFSKSNYTFFLYNSFNQILADVPRFLIDCIIVILFIIFGYKFVFLNNINNNLFTYQSIVLYIFAFFRLAPVLQSIYSSLSAMKGNIMSFRILKNDFINSYDFELLENFNYNDNVTNIDYENISFEKNLNKKDFKLNFDHFKLSINENTLITGPNGSGKTTFCDILMGILVPDKSLIRINDKVINFKDLESLKLFSYAPQNGYLFNSTILFNITFENDINLIDQNELNEIIQILNLKKLIFSFDNNYNFLLKEGGKNLSMGQRQKIILARALYNSRKFIILDEPTNFLDNETSLNLIKEIINFCKNKNKSLLVISHNEEHKILFKKIVEFHNGNFKIFYN